METQSRTLTTARKARARRGVCWGLAVFAALQACFHVPLGYRYPELKDGEYGHKLTRLKTQLERHPRDRPLVIGLGSSLTLLGLRPDVLGHSSPTRSDGPLVYNFGLNSGLAISQLLCLHRLLDERIRPDWVLVEIFPRFYFLGDATHVEPISVGRLQRRDLALVDRYYRDPGQVRGDWCRQQCAPWYYHRNLLQNLFLPSWVPKEKSIYGVWRCMDEWGWNHTPEVIEKLKREYHAPEFADRLRQAHDAWNQQAFTEKYDAALRELIRVCRSEKIGVVLVRMPESSHYRATYTDAMRDTIGRWLPSLAAGPGVSVVDACEWLADSEFADGFHADPQGAFVFTRRLETEVLQHLRAAGERSPPDDMSVARTPNRHRRL